jgi:hypothetical protein
MKTSHILQDVLRVTCICSALGVGVGVISGLINEQMRISERKKLEFRLPADVQNHEEFKTAIMVMADEKYADLQRLERVARRCETLLNLYTALVAADPKTVKASVSSVASELEASIIHHLGLFYHASYIPVVEQNYKRMKHFLPLNRDLKFGHETMLQCIEGIVHDIHMAVKSKLEQKF